jgi:hypothetical protein
MSTDTALVPQQAGAMVVEDQRFFPAMEVAHAQQRYNAIVEFTKTIMKEGKDYGAVPGTDKPTLLKPGAEKLTSFFGFTVESPIFVERVEDWTGATHGGQPFFYYLIEQRLSRNGQLVASQIGSCNSWETKYRYRWVKESDIPPGLDKTKLPMRDGTISEFAFAVEKSETTGQYGKPAEYWNRFKAAITAGTAQRIKKPTRGGKEMDAWAIGAPAYRVPNESIFDQVNTIQKMAEKRALVAATLIACNASEFYTQDMEDLDLIDVPFGSPFPTAAPSAHAPQPAPAAGGGAKLDDVLKPPPQAQPPVAPPPTNQADATGSSAGTNGVDPPAPSQPPAAAPPAEAGVSLSEIAVSLEAVNSVALCNDWRKNVLPTLPEAHRKEGLKMLFTKQLTMETSIVACARIANECPDLAEAAKKRQDAIRANRPSQQSNGGGQR